MDNTEESSGQLPSYRTRKNQQRGRAQSNTNPTISRRGREGRHYQVNLPVYHEICSMLNTCLVLVYELLNNFVFKSYEAKRMENFRMMEEEMAQTEDNATKVSSFFCGKYSLCQKIIEPYLIQ